MRTEDQPPERIWLDPEALHEHFERLDEKYRTGAGDSESVPAADLDQNELTAALKRR